MKHIKNLLILPLFLLSSCGEVNIYGRYSFRLGKESETHIGIIFDLFNEDFVVEDEVKGEKFTFTFDSNQQSNELMDVIGNTFSGYYNVIDNITSDYGKRLALGAHISHETLPFIPEDFSFDIDPDIIESIIIAYINNKQVTVQLPVSIEDLSYQLCWYGYYLDLSSESIFIKLDENKLPGEKGDARFGTHPIVKKDQFNKVISSEVVMMNDNFAKEFSNTYIYQGNNSIAKIAKKSDNNYYLYNNSEFVISSDDINITVDENNIKLNLSKINEGEYLINSAILSSTQEAFDLSLIINEPFKFRDFHDIRVGLLKE